MENTGSRTADDERNDSTVNSSDMSSLRAETMRRYEAQLGLLSSMSQASAAAANMFSYNPYMMSSLAGLTGYGALPGTAGLAGLSAAAAGGADYQAALAAAMASSYPTAALYPAALGYPSMPFTPADYVSALSAFSSSMLPTVGSTAGSPAAPSALDGLTSSASTELTRNSPALSHSSRSSTATATAHSSNHRRGTPHKSTPNHMTDGRRSRSSSSPRYPKKARPTPSSSGKDKEREKINSSSKQGDAASFFKGLTAEELDVNTHFKNSLGNLYNNGLEHKFPSPSPLSQDNCEKATNASSITPAATPASVQSTQDMCLDLSIKPPHLDAPARDQTSSSPALSSAGSAASNATSSANHSRKSVIQTTTSVGRSSAHTNANMSSAHGREDCHSVHSSITPSLSQSPCPASTSTGQPASELTSELTSGPTAHAVVPSNHEPPQHKPSSYEALPNLKRLSDQLVAGKGDLTQHSTSSSKAGKQFVSLLKHDNSSLEENKGKRKVRRGKAHVDESSTKKQRMLEEDRADIRMKLEREMKQQQVNAKLHKRASKKYRQAQAAAGDSTNKPQTATSNPSKPRNRRKSNQKPRTSGEADIVFPNPTLTAADPPKPKRIYIRTKLAKEKSVDMVKLAVPFEYGWRRETRIRGISKNGRIVGEVFYFSPNDKRMRSFNDVLKYLNQLRASQEHEQTAASQEHEQTAASQEHEQTAASQGNDTSGDAAGTTVVSVSEMGPPATLSTTLPLSPSAPLTEQQNSDHSINKIVSTETHMDTETHMYTEMADTDTKVSTPASDPTDARSEKEAEQSTTPAVPNSGVASGKSLPNSSTASGKPLPNSSTASGKPLPNSSTASGKPPQWLVLTKEHFSFSTKVKLGDFMEQKPGEKYVLLNDTERDKRIQLANDKRMKQMEKLNKVKAKKLVLKENARRIEQAKVDKERKQLEMVSKSVEQKLRKQLEKEKTKAEIDVAKRQRAVATLLKKRQLQEEKDRDRLEKQERARYLLEERERKLRELREQKARQRLEKSMMKERQRQSLINSKIMETKRREEEKRRHQIEKIVQKERRQEIKKRQLELTRELKQPVEDLRLPNLKNLPTLNRIPGMKLSGNVFANILQCHQFITNFHECLELKQSVPSLNTFQHALLGDSKQSKHSINKVLCHLLSFAIQDPGVRSPAKFSNEIGQKLSNLIIDEWSFSEILRVYMLERDSTPVQITRELEQKPFDSLCTELKSEAMAWLCDELNTSQAVTEEIDNNMESVLNLRRDKWELEGKIRELKSNSMDVNRSAGRTKDPDNSDQSENEEEATADQVSSTEGNKTQTQVSEKKMDSADEKKLEKLNKQYTKCCKDVVTKCGTVRTFPYGMDRYRRYYWSLPHFKGVLVESLESSVHSTASAPTDSSLSMEEPTPDSQQTLPSTDSGKEMVKEEKTEPGASKVEPLDGATANIKLDQIKCEENGNASTSGVSETNPSSTDTVVDSIVSQIQPTSNIVTQRINGVVHPSHSIVNTTHNIVSPLHSHVSTSPSTVTPSPSIVNASRNNIVNSSSRSIASWLNSTIDNIFTKEVANQVNGSPSYGSLTSNQTSSQFNSATSLTSTPPLSTSRLAQNLPPQLYNQQDTIDTWFELGRKLPCDNLDKFSPQLVANSLAFMNCVTGSEEQKELEALERLTAKAELLDSDKTVPTDVQRGWWIITDHEQVKSLSSSLHPRAIREKQLNRLLTKNREKIEHLCSDQTVSTDVELDCDVRDSEIAKSVYHAPTSDRDTPWVEEQCRTTELSILDKMEDLEERVFQASIYTKNWAEKNKQDTTDLVLVVTPSQEVKDGERRIIDLVKEKLLMLESGIERRYLKPPFIKSNALQLADIVLTDDKPCENGVGTGEDSDTSESSKDSDENCSKGLLQWKQAVRAAVNLSQLYISLEQLEKCIAWEKSVMRVLCQVCRSDDNEDQLLLCDNCDKGYHTYCFKPKMTTIPSGKWYCWECKSKATGVAHCIRCGKSTGRMAQCHKCPQAIHLDCSSPPFSRVPRKHTCGHCMEISNQKGRKQKRLSKQKTHESSDEGELTDDGGASESAAGEDPDEEEDQAERDISVCRELMKEIEKHRDAEPFLEPVDTKAFPQYKKYIKQPMDLSKISSKLANGQYETRTEFYDDMILIFDNCLLFNEDNSDVGKSGKSLRRHFMKQWKQLSAI